MADLRPPVQPSRGATSEERLQYRKDYEAYRREIERRATEIRQRPFREAEEAERQAAEAGAALQRQLEEQARVKAQVGAELAEAEKQAKVAGRRSAAVSSQLRSRSMLEQAQVRQASTQTALTLRAQQRKQPGTTVGQPGRSRTRVGSGLGIGGYGGTRAARVSPTGLNI